MKNIVQLGSCLTFEKNPYKFVNKLNLCNYVLQRDVSHTWYTQKLSKGSSLFINEPQSSATSRDILLAFSLLTNGCSRPVSRKIMKNREILDLRAKRTAEKQRNIISKSLNNSSSLR